MRERGVLAQLHKHYRQSTWLILLIWPKGTVGKGGFKAHSDFRQLSTISQVEKWDKVHRIMYRYMVCGNTMCVSTCQLDFVLRASLILLPRSRLFGCSGDFSVLKRTVLLIWADGKEIGWDYYFSL